MDKSNSSISVEDKTVADVLAAISKQNTNRIIPKGSSETKKEIDELRES